MFSRRINSVCKKIISAERHFHLSKQKNAKKEHPYLRALRILNNDVKSVFQAPNLTKMMDVSHIFPTHVDVVIIGGGGMGSSIAYWLKEKTSREGINVVVLEKDLTVSFYICNSIINNR